MPRKMYVGQIGNVAWVRRPLTMLRKRQRRTLPLPLPKQPSAPRAHRHSPPTQTIGERMTSAQDLLCGERVRLLVSVGELEAASNAVVARMIAGSADWLNPSLTRWKLFRAPRRPKDCAQLGFCSLRTA